MCWEDVYTGKKSGYLWIMLFMGILIFYFVIFCIFSNKHVLFKTSEKRGHFWGKKINYSGTVKCEVWISNCLSKEILKIWLTAISIPVDSIND